MQLNIFRNLGTTIESTVVAPAQSVAMSLSSYLVPIVLSGLTIWVMVYALAVTRGAVHSPVSDFAWRVLKLSLILFFGIAGGIFQPDAFGFYTDISNTIYNAITFGGGGECPVPRNDPMGVYGALDCIGGQIFTPFLKSFGKLSELLSPPGAGLWDIIGNVVAAFIPVCFCVFFIGVSFIAYAVLIVFIGFEVISTRILLAFALALSPLFCFALAFEPIKEKFTNWLNFVLKSIILTALFIAYMGILFQSISNFINDYLLVTIATPKEDLGDLVYYVAATCLGFVNFCILLGVLLFTATRIPNLATELMGGQGSSGLGAFLVGMASQGLFKASGGKLGNPFKKKSGGEVTNNS